MEESRFARFVGLLNRTAKAIQRIKSVKMKEYGLSAAHTTCLCRLAEAGPAGLTQSGLIRLEGMDRAHISRVLGDLQGRNYVTPAAQGGRYKKRYLLTPAGQAVAGEIQSVIVSVNRFVSGQIPQEDLEVFYRTLDKIAENLEQAAAACCQNR